jgi:hypothetical protein
MKYQVYDMFQQYEPTKKSIIKKEILNIYYTHIVSRNGGECLIRKVDNIRLCINVNTYGTIIAISNNICHRIIYIFG